MQVGIITCSGMKVGVIVSDSGNVADPFSPDLDGYEPEGRAEQGTSGHLGGHSSDHAGALNHHSHGGNAPAPGAHHTPPPIDHKHNSIRYGHHHAPGQPAPPGKEFHESPGASSTFRQGTGETDQAIKDAAAAHNLDVNTMRGIASIESSMNPSSNANRSTQYKGLYQVGRNEWDRFGNGGNIYSAHDNAMGAARMFDANRSQFQKHFHRDPTDTELYMMHQQGLGFYTNNAMTNISGNPYPGMHGPQTHDSFEAGWGRELARRKAGFAARDNASPTAARAFDPATMVP